MQISNPCARCGQERILFKRWDDSVNNNAVTYSMWVCPDQECQSQVDAGVAAKKEKAQALRRDIEDRAIARKASLNKSHQRTT